MLSALGVYQHAGTISFQLARALCPLLSGGLGAALSLAARRTLSSVPAPALSVQSVSDNYTPNVHLPRFNPDGAHSLAGAVLETHHPSARFSAVLSQYRSQYPEQLWSKLVSLFPRRHLQPPLAIDIAVGGEGRAGVELAKRGFRVLSVGGDSTIVNRTFVCAELNHARINLISAQAEQTLVPSCAADLVTCCHGIHLLDTPQALAECHRVLKPQGRLVVAFNDRDLKNGFVDSLEGLIERHIPSYSRAERQHHPAHWAPRLQAGGLFRLAESFQLSNPLALKNLATLSDILNSQSYVRGALTGAARKAFNADVRSLVEERFGQGPLLLPMVTRVFVLEKVAGPSQQ